MGGGAKSTFYPTPSDGMVFLAWGCNMTNFQIEISESINLFYNILMKKNSQKK